MDDPKSKLKLAREAIEAAVVAFENGPAAPSPSLRARPFSTRDRALLWLASMQRRARVVEEQLHEGSWAILMDLYVNKGVRPISVSSACIASGRPPSTALRWVGRLVELGLVTRENDDIDGRRAYLVLTAKGEAAVLAHLGD